MAIGSVQVADCCPIQDPPMPPFQRLDLSYSVQTTGNYSAQLETEESMRGCLGPCCLERSTNRIVNRWSGGTREYFNIDLNHTISGSSTFEYSGNTILSYNIPTIPGTSAKFFRPGTNIVLKNLTGSDYDFKGRRWQLSNTSATYTTRLLSITFGQSPPFPFCQSVTFNPGLCGPCYEATTKTFPVYNISPGAIASSSPTLQGVGIFWVNITNIDITAFRVSLTPAGVAQGSWDLNCISGVIRITSDSGIVLEASGSLTSCVAQLEVGGYVDASIFLNVTADANSSDLKDASFTLGKYPCNVDLLFAARGDEVSPKSGQTGLGYSTGLFPTDPFSAASEYENTIDGFTSWIQANRKLSICPCLPLNRGLVDSSNSVISAFPGSYYLFALNPLGATPGTDCFPSSNPPCPASYWSLTPPVTTVSFEDYGGTPTVFKYDLYIAPYEDGFVDKCTATEWPEDLNYEEACLAYEIAAISDVTSYPAPRPVVNWVRSASGSWNIS